MKCLEFLYFYLLDENGNPMDTLSDIPHTDNNVAFDIPTVPNSPTNPSHTRSALSVSQLSDSSVGSDFSMSSGGSQISAATTATTASASSGRSETTKDAPREISSLAPSPSIRPEPKHDNPGKQPRGLAMLRKDVDFVPETPHPVRPTKSVTGLRPSRPTAGMSQRQSSDVPLTPLEPLGEWKTPRKGPPRMQATSYGEGGPKDLTTPAALDRLRGHRRAHTVDVNAETKSGSQSPVSPTSSTFTFPDRKELTSSNPVARSGMTSVGNVNVVSPPRKQVSTSVTRTMEEKKAILGSMMGNVDKLVEGVKKAGIWGLG